MFDLLWLDDEKVVNRAPSLDTLFIEDLNIDFLTEAMFDGMESKLTSAQLCNLFAVDAADVAERQNILKDLIAYPELLQLFKDLLSAILAWQDFFAIPNMDDTTSDLEAFFAMNNYAHAESYFNIINEAKAKIAEFTNLIMDIKGTYNCPNCGTEVATTAAFCANCGSKLEAPAKAEKAQTVEETPAE